jgi:hypothetical protein
MKRFWNPLVQIAILILSIYLIDCCGNHRHSSGPFEAYANDSLRFEIYKAALNNQSTSPSYIVINVTNRGTGEHKELCTEAPFLEGALHIEYGFQYDSVGVTKAHKFALLQKNRAFEFSNREALNNIGFFEYPPHDTVFQYAKGLDLEYYKRKYGDNRSSTSFSFLNQPTEKLLFAHSLFQCGIISSRGCINGDILSLGNPNLDGSQLNKNSIPQEDSVHYQAIASKPAMR